MAVVLCHCEPSCYGLGSLDQPMSTVLVTGATDGLGRALATRLASEGATVLAHARSEERGRETLAELLDGPGDVRLVVGDLASLSAVRALADQVPDRLDVLVNNAGIGFAGGRAGERRTATSCASPSTTWPGFLLASLLRDRLARRRRRGSSTSPPPASRRSTSTTSCSSDGYDGARAYRQSKLAQIMHAFDLAEELAAGA